MNPEDLSVYHHAISTIFPPISNPLNHDSYRLSDEQVCFFNENGYLAGLRILHDSEIETLREELKDLINPDHPGNSLFYEFHSNESADPASVVFHALGAWRIKPGFHDLLWHPAFLIPASQLLGGGLRFWHDQLFCKPAYHGGVVAWHQDYSYWTRTTPLAHLTCWIGLDDSTVDNGCVRYVPGSHLWPDLPITGLTGEMDAVQSVLTAEQKAKFKPVAIELKKGECTFHHPRIIHGSYGNTTSSQRRATIINMFRDGVASNSDSPLLKGVPVIPKGEKMGGQFFPLLFNPD
jgi:ectoine hydroxylase-related dioxygenase (phytanoyl-CoA dioxygenase family)